MRKKTKRTVKSIIRKPKKKVNKAKPKKVIKKVEEIKPEIKQEKKVICQFCGIEMEQIEPNTYKCPKCGRTILFMQ